MKLEPKIVLELPNTPAMRTFLHKLIANMDPEGPAGIAFLEVLAVALDEDRLQKQEPSISDALEDADRRAVAKQNAASQAPKSFAAMAAQSFAEHAPPGAVLEIRKPTEPEGFRGPSDDDFYGGTPCPSDQCRCTDCTVKRGKKRYEAAVAARQKPQPPRNITQAEINKSHAAVIAAEMIYPKVIRSWPSSSPGKTYDLLEGADGNIYCSCPAWKFSKARPKVCKHMEEWAATIAKNGAVFDITRKP